MKITLAFICTCISIQFSFSQDFGDFPEFEKEKLLNDLELLYQGLDKFHSGMYWYTPKDSVEMAFEDVKKKINKDLDVLEFHKLIAPLVALSREGHTNISLPKEVNEKIKKESRFLPLTTVFIDKKLFCIKNGSNHQNFEFQGKEIESINGEKPTEIVNKIGDLFASDGFIKVDKYYSFFRFKLSVYYFYYYGEVNQFEIKFKGIKDPVILQPLKVQSISENLKNRYEENKTAEEKEILEYELLANSTAYLGIHTFSNSKIKEKSEENLKTFLENSFKSIAENNISNLIIDVSRNGGGDEGNEGLLYSYFGDNYQKYKKVRAKTQKAVLDNGTDEPITLKTFSLLQRIFINKKMNDGSLERRQWIGHGLMAYKKEPEYKFSGKVYVIISPNTYSGGSEFANMMYTQNLATFVGQETGGGYYGNTSGYKSELILPNSKIEISIPALQFIMNVEPKLPFGSGVKPDYEVIPTFEQRLNNDNVLLQYIIENLLNQK